MDLQTTSSSSAAPREAATEVSRQWVFFNVPIGIAAGAASLRYIGAGLPAPAAVITPLALSGRGGQGPARPATRAPRRRPDPAPVLRVPLPDRYDQG